MVSADPARTLAAIQIIINQLMVTHVAQGVLIADNRDIRNIRKATFAAENAMRNVPNVANRTYVNSINAPPNAKHRKRNIKKF